jgi:uncharacterized protein YecT (DUF1311 family)
MRQPIVATLVFVLAGLLTGLLAAPRSAPADARQPTDKEAAAIRACAVKYQDDLDKIEQQCLFKLVGDVCIKKLPHENDHDMGDCYYTESVIWDGLLNENFKKLLGTLDDQQSEKLRAMQRAWIAYRDTTCNFYWDKIQGTMAQPMVAGCIARETARRAVLLQLFNGL